MITSHGYPQQSPNIGEGYQTPSSVDTAEDLKDAEDLQARHEMINSGSTNSAGDPFSPNFSEDDFDIPIPPSALEEHPSHHMHQYNSYPQQHHGQQQHHQMLPPNGMYHQHAQHIHPQQQQQQQQQWNQQYHHHHHMNAYNQYDQQYSYNYGSMYHPQQSHPVHQQANIAQQNSNVIVPPQHAMQGGPSPVGSHNTPSPQSHSEDGENDHHARNNNVLKRPSPGEEHGHVHVHSHGHHPHHHHHHGHPHTGPGRPPLMSAGGHHGIGVSATAKKPKVSKRKKKRDPNEPQKPVSAYALFFRDSQASIKAANPNAAFGDVSKIVASMWDALDPDNKAAYKKRTENAKKDYLKKLAAYRASLVSKGSGDVSAYAPFGYAAYAEAVQNGSLMGNKSQSYIHGYAHGQPVPPRPPMQQTQQSQQQQQPQQHVHHHGFMHHHHQHLSNGMVSATNQNNSQQQQQQQQQHSPGDTSSIQSQQPQHSPSLSSQSSSSQQSQPRHQNLDEGQSPSNGEPRPPGQGQAPQGQQQQQPLQRCRRPGCNNPIQRGIDGWNNSEYCSNECVVGQCREVYSSWSAGTSGQAPNQHHPPPPHPSMHHHHHQQYAPSPPVK